MLNKLKFNNLIISNKKGIQQSRTQTINKLVHKIRKLKSLLEKRPDDTKCKERIRKSTETMELLKKLKRIDVMKKVLLMDKPASAVITNGTSTPEEVAVALLSMNKVMHCLAKRFKAELNLNETENVEWKQDLIESSKRSQRIGKTEEKRRNRLELKQRKAVGRKRQEWLEEYQHNMGENISIDASTGAWNIEELSNDTNKKLVAKVEKKFNEDSKRNIEGESYAKKTTIANKKQKNANSRTESKKFKEEIKVDNEVINTIKEMSNTFEPPQNESSSATVEDTSDSLAIDPFFITDTGENYMSTSIIKKDTFTENPVGLRDKNQKYLKQKNKWSVEGSQRNKWNNKHNYETDQFSQNKWNDKKNLQMGQQGSEHKKFAKTSDLHPSWAAKQKLKPFITGFQGQKIIFKDDDFSKPNKHSEEKGIKSNKSTTLQPNKSEMNSLHPSWAAKQKLKSSITTFQGKKIIFNYDE